MPDLDWLSAGFCSSCCALDNAIFIYLEGGEDERDTGIIMLESPGAKSVDSMGSWEVIEGEMIHSL